MEKNCFKKINNTVKAYLMSYHIMMYLPDVSYLDFLLNGTSLNHTMGKEQGMLLEDV